MPTSFTFQIEDEVDDMKIKVDIKMEMHKVHYEKLLRIAPYWRYHVKAKGYISLGSLKEQVNDTQIMEFLKFG